MSDPSNENANFAPQVAPARSLTPQQILGRRRCMVCQHPDRWRLELLRAGGASLDALATKFGVSRDSVHLHWKKHVSDEMKAGYLAGPTQLQELAAKAAEQGGSVLDHLHAIRVVLMGQMAAMVESGDGRGVAYVSGRLTTVLETIAKISGELGDLARSVTINHTTNNVAVLHEHPAFARLQAAMLRALGPFPDARAAVVGALRDLDAGNAPMSTAPRVIDHVAA